MPNFISEDDIEQALLQKLRAEYGYDVLNCYTATPEDLNDGSGRQDKRDVFLADRVKTALVRLNPEVPESVIDGAVEQVCDRRRAMSLIEANREIDELVRNGVSVEYEDETGKRVQKRLKVIHFDAVDQNDFLAVSQLTIRGEQRFRRPDVLIYVNGIPLVFVELKNSNVKLKTAYTDNLTHYKADIPQLFLANAVCVLSNAGETKVGSFTADWEFFHNWLRVADEKEKVDRDVVKEAGTSLELVAEGLLAPEKLLDFVENFVVYFRKTNKVVAQNHQFLGVNKAFESFKNREALSGKLGVFWHTQGAGKSFSMIFYVRKIFRKLTGNFSFVVVTDRKDLNDQIYGNFLDTETVKKSEAVEPKDSAEMRKFLGMDKRLVFTLIQKFTYPKGKTYPTLSERNEIVVIVDEAHRTQYRSLAENMRRGLPHAQFLAFTGTPLLGRQRKTHTWFGDYVSEYNFQQSVDDGATVPLFYEKRVPEVLIQNDDLSDEFYELLEDENLDDLQQTKLERKYASEIEVIKRDPRLETIAKDIVYHFPRRGYLGKGLVITLDKFTAVKMYDKVQRLWKDEIRALRGQIRQSADDLEKARLKKIVEYMRSVEMAVVVSEEAGEEDKFREQGLDIKPHRERMNRLDEHGQDIEDNFKDPKHPLQLVFVCAMWLTGFDAPTVSTLYMDKPMKDHTLMQTIARANRVTSWQVDGKPKINGEIIDYYNVFRNMKKALKDYAQGQEGVEDPPVREKAVLFDLLNEAIEQGTVFCKMEGIDLQEILVQTDVFKNVAQFYEFADVLMARDERRKGFFVYENTISALYEACKPEILGRPVVRDVAVFQYLRGVVDSIIQQQDLDAVGRRVGELLDESLVVKDADDFLSREGSETTYRIFQRGQTWDLSRIDFEKLREDFKAATYKNIEISDLRAFIEKKLAEMLNQNVTRIDFVERLQSIIDAYNAGSSTNDAYFEELMKFTRDLQAEEQRHIREGLTEDELELFDLLKKDKMTQDETQQVRLAAKSLLHRLLEEHPNVLVQDWFKDSQTQKVVRSAVEKVLDTNLPESYDRIAFAEKCDNVFELMVDYASQGRKWAG